MAAGHVSYSSVRIDFLDDDPALATAGHAAGEDCALCYGKAAAVADDCALCYAQAQGRGAHDC